MHKFTISVNMQCLQCNNNPKKEMEICITSMDSIYEKKQDLTRCNYLPEAGSVACILTLWIDKIIQQRFVFLSFMDINFIIS